MGVRDRPTWRSQWPKAGGVRHAERCETVFAKLDSLAPGRSGTSSRTRGDWTSVEAAKQIAETLKIDAFLTKGGSTSSRALLEFVKNFARCANSSVPPLFVKTMTFGGAFRVKAARAHVEGHHVHFSSFTERSLEREVRVHTADRSTRHLPDVLLASGIVFLALGYTESTMESILVFHLVHDNVRGTTRCQFPMW